MSHSILFTHIFYFETHVSGYDSFSVYGVSEIIELDTFLDLTEASKDHF